MLLQVFCLALLIGISGDSVVGLWQTIDDETGEPKAIVEIDLRDGLLYGRIARLYPEEGDDVDPLCDKCPDERRDKPIIGMTIIDGLRRKGERWGAGTILDPEKGKLYACQLWREDEVLRVRGSVFIFHRTQTWIRAPSEDDSEEALPALGSDFEPPHQSAAP